MRRITTHHINEFNTDHVDIMVTDEPGAGGANHEYRLSLLADPDPGTPKITAEKWSQKISFQNGPVKEAGVNGVTQEALLAIVIDRLQSFQKGPYACRENAMALTKCEEALHWLQSRTKARVERGVEGTNQV